MPAKQNRIQYLASDAEKLSKVYGKIFDRFSIGALHKLSVKKAFSQLEFPINEGKEATVFRAVDHAGNFRAVKIYKIKTSDFNRMSRYVVGDERFRGIPKDRKEMVFTWTRKEFANLERANSAGVSVPKPIAFLDNVLVMEFIGDKKGNPFSSLKEFKGLEKGSEEAERIVEKMLEFVARLYYGAGMVHADFSEYNLLYGPGIKDGKGSKGGQGIEDAKGAKGKKLVLIDIGQAVLESHPKAMEFLERDLKNIANYSTRIGIELSPGEAKARVKEWEKAIKKEGLRRG